MEKWRNNTEATFSVKDLMASTTGVSELIRQALKDVQKTKSSLVVLPNWHSVIVRGTREEVAAVRTILLANGYKEGI